MADRASIPPFVYKVISGRKLDALRSRAGLTQEHVAKHLGCAQSKIANIESGLSNAHPDDLAELLNLYDADPATRQECEDLVRSGRKRAPRNALRSRFEGEMQQVVDMEASANVIWARSAMIIPGLLQIEAYMRYVFRAYRPSLTQEQIDRYTENRLARQEVLGNLHQRFWFNIDEAALRRMANMDGGSEIMRQQIEHLISMIDRPNIEIQAVPFETGYYMGQDINYRIFGYETDPPAQLVYVEQYDGGNVLHDGKSVHRFLSLWDHQKAVGLGPDQTRAFFARVASSL
ncbi:helix-turn-helix domain-containing protein [Solihabitans fulvus]|uniref:Helix-turn-helix domain-containing protein n=1 Tax=Solihabitans fulvus TaxID=1892852 RepID=A0A5B2WKM4_9PSEU|nr:helix-turn-helix transcriptional regulator [Solihabitans fulvus]KAA2252371.1 helix-turn-helix domain-containing protein [Solihabitans fulvus]